jgi:hypothetical protein
MSRPFTRAALRLAPLSWRQRAAADSVSRHQVGAEGLTFHDKTVMAD